MNRILILLPVLFVSVFTANFDVPIEELQKRLNSNFEEMVKIFNEGRKQLSIEVHFKTMNYLTISPELMGIAKTRSCDGPPGRDHRYFKIFLNEQKFEEETKKFEKTVALMDQDLQKGLASIGDSAYFLELLHPTQSMIGCAVRTCSDTPTLLCVFGPKGTISASDLELQPMPDGAKRKTNFQELGEKSKGFNPGMMTPVKEGDSLNSANSASTLLSLLIVALFL